MVHSGEYFDCNVVVSSKVRLFADDCKNKEDKITPQKDLNLLENWGNTWGMRFNAAKCNIMECHGPATLNFSTTH